MEYRYCNLVPRMCSPDPMMALHSRFILATVLHETKQHSVIHTLFPSTQALLHRDELYWLPRDKYESDIQYLRQKEEDWVGQAVITRRDTDGLYYPGGGHSKPS